MTGTVVDLRTVGYLYTFRIILIVVRSVSQFTRFCYSEYIKVVDLSSLKSQSVTSSVLQWHHPPLIQLSWILISEPIKKCVCTLYVRKTRELYNNKFWRKHWLTLPLSKHVYFARDKLIGQLMGNGVLVYTMIIKYSNFSTRQWDSHNSRKN